MGMGPCSILFPLGHVGVAGGMEVVRKGSGRSWR